MEDECLTPQEARKMALDISRKADKDLQDERHAETKQLFPDLFSNNSSLKLTERYIIQTLIAQAIYDTAYIIAHWRLKSDTKIPHITKMLHTYIENNIVDILEESIIQTDMPKNIVEQVQHELDNLLK